jgi:hypothetical protein
MKLSAVALHLVETGELLGGSRPGSVTHTSRGRARQPGQRHRDGILLAVSRRSRPGCPGRHWRRCLVPPAAGQRRTTSPARQPDRRPRRSAQARRAAARSAAARPSVPRARPVTPPPRQHRQRAQVPRSAGTRNATDRAGPAVTTALVSRVSRPTGALRMPVMTGQKALSDGTAIRPSRAAGPGGILAAITGIASATVVASMSTTASAISATATRSLSRHQHGRDSNGC